MQLGFARASVRVEVDGPSKHLKVEGEIVLTVKCEDGGILCDWAETWKVWDDLQKNAELKALTDKCANILSGGGKGKGTSKGK